METLINLILWWVTLISIVSDSQPVLEKKKKSLSICCCCKTKVHYLHSKKQKHRNKIIIIIITTTVPMVLGDGSEYWSLEMASWSCELDRVPEWFSTSDSMVHPGGRSQSKDITTTPESVSSAPQMFKKTLCEGNKLNTLTDQEGKHSRSRSWRSIAVARRSWPAAEAIFSHV